ncbi:MAG: MupG family TIM beta-alpha barrel fold protein [Streptococcaceae bacterium]|nr:MupG family TIM beta-alpha barrel fold protein [Streptococcaceae bacterium]
MFGLSVYLQDGALIKNLENIKKMADRGFNGIFTSMQLPEDDESRILVFLEEVGKIAKEKQMKFMVDVSAAYFKKQGLSTNKLDKLLRLGINGIRADDGFSSQSIAEMSHQMTVGLNASVLTQKDVEELKFYQADFDRLEAWHNFYPRPETGLSRAFLKKKNQQLKHQGFKTVAFVAGDSERRYPLKKGLPTLEAHRYKSPFVSMLDLLSLDTDEIYIGDGGISEKSLNSFGQYGQEGLIPIEVEAVNARYNSQIFRIHQNRPDSARDVFRSRFSRSWGISDIPSENCIERKKGAITLDNASYGRYKGELQLCKKSLPSDGKVNVIGQVISEDLELLDYLNENQKIILIERR